MLLTSKLKHSECSGLNVLVIFRKNLTFLLYVKYFLRYNLLIVNFDVGMGWCCCPAWMLNSIINQLGVLWGIVLVSIRWIMVKIVGLILSISS